MSKSEHHRVRSTVGLTKQTYRSIVRFENEQASVERYEMPSGAEVFYKPASHSYWATFNEKKGTCSDRLAGASTVAKNDGDVSADGLIDWGAKLSCEGVARELAMIRSLDPEDIPGALTWTDSGDSIWSLLQREKLTWRSIREEAGQRGSYAHDTLENLTRGSIPIAKTGWDRGVIDWWLRTKPEPVEVERVVYSEKLGVAGRFDLLYRKDSLLTLCDLKSSKWLSHSFFIQTNLYRIAAIESGFPTPDRLTIIQVREDGSWDEVEVPIREDWALAAIATYRAGAEIRAAIKKAKAPKLSQVAA